MILNDEIKEIMTKLAEPLPSDAIQRTKTSQTRKGYDTDGYGYQFCVNRFNEVLGDKWGFNYKILETEKGKYSSGGDKIDLTIECNIWILENNQDHIRSCIGGHTSKTYCDAFKGAITNSFKKTAAFWGVGRHAYEGALDDDNDPAKCAFENQQQDQQQKPPQQTKPQTPKQQDQQGQQKPDEQQPPKGKQETIDGEKDNGNGKEITPQILCGMVANATNKGKDKNDKTNYVKLWEFYVYEQHGVKHLTELSSDQMIKEKGIIEKNGKPRPADFRNFLKGYEKYLVQENPVDEKIEIIQDITLKLNDVFQGKKDKIDWQLSRMNTEVTTLDDLKKLSQEDINVIADMVNIVYEEYTQAQSHIHDQQEAGALN